MEKEDRLILTIILVVCATVWGILAPQVSGYGWLILLAFLIN
jgi:hypothetical protein